MDPVSEMTVKEMQAVREFRQNTADVIPRFTSDYYRHDLGLLRFLRARELNLKKSEEMLRMHLNWRAEKQLEGILARDFHSYYEDYPVKICGRDRAGHLVLSAPIGKWDFRAVADAGHKDIFTLFCIQWFERAMKIFSKITTENKYYAQTCVIFDFDGFPYRQLASKEVITMLIELLRTFEDNYPEILRIVWIINAPTIFNILWGIVKPFLTERTTSKVRIHGSDRNKWRAELLTMITEGNLPSVYGGRNTSCPNYKFQPDVNISMLTPHFGKCPEEDMRQVTVAARELYNVEVTATVGLRIHWTFETDHWDILFRVDFEDIEDVIEPCRVDSHLCVQKGTILCDQNGRYTLVFDNSYSSFKGKCLRYLVWTS